jgi:hypothetical protein
MKCYLITQSVYTEGPVNKNLPHSSFKGFNFFAAALSKAVDVVSPSIGQYLSLTFRDSKYHNSPN